MDKFVGSELEYIRDILARDRRSQQYDNVNDQCRESSEADGTYYLERGIFHDEKINIITWNKFSIMKNALIVLFSVLTYTGIAQNKYGLKATNLVEYQASLKANPNKELINLKVLIPNLVLDIRYATTNNFTSEKIYNLARAYARKPV